MHDYHGIPRAMIIISAWATSASAFTTFLKPDGSVVGGFESESSKLRLKISVIGGFQSTQGMSMSFTKQSKPISENTLSHVSLVIPGISNFELYCCSFQCFSLHLM
ncbi:hypothetical protein M8J77_006074 [Diaphorina citri]|nr:hypothetical protein M8J77_006074 [Diaphorina citri]